jgi:hypothetical protein
LTKLDDKYRLRTFAELGSDPIPVTLINEPVPPDNVRALVPRARSLHAVLCESLVNTKALLTRLETTGVYVARAEQREIIRLLYVATRHQAKALAAVLELDGLE